MARSPDGQTTRSDDPINLVLAAAAGPSMESSAETFASAAPFEAAPNRRTTSTKTMPNKTTSLKSASFISVIKVATVVASVIWTIPAVPGASADKDPVREPTRSIVAVGRATIRIVRVITIRADRRASYIAAKANAHSDSDLSLRVRERQRQ